MTAFPGAIRASPIISFNQEEYTAVHTQTSHAARYIFARLDPGEDVLDSLQSTVSEQGIRNAVFVSGVGSLDRYHVHVVKTTNLPPGNVFFKGEGAYDILAVTGLVIDGKVHAHITFSNPESAMGGHLEQGCRVLTFAVVALVETSDGDFSAWDTVGPLQHMDRE
jgi:predicted DNA-binding protein with PD1-like motif